MKILAVNSNNISKVKFHARTEGFVHTFKILVGV